MAPAVARVHSAAPMPKRPAAGSEAAVARYCAQLLASAGTETTHGGAVSGKAPAASAAATQKTK